jgi:hypothetical protein
MQETPNYPPHVSPAVDGPAYPGPGHRPLTVQERFRYDRLLARAYADQMLRIRLGIEDIGREVRSLMNVVLVPHATEEQLLADVKAQVWKYRKRFYEKLKEFLKSDDYFVILPELVREHVSKTVLVLGDSNFLPGTTLMQSLGKDFGLINISLP